MVGCGYASWFQLTAWSQIEGVEIVAVCSRTREKAEQRAAEFNIPIIYQDYETMLDEEPLDFVDIATPPVVHLDMVRQAADKGLQILCQKPIADTLHELREMIRICDQADVTFMVNENGRFQPYYRKVKELIRGDVIGRPYYANLTARKRLSLPDLRFKQPFFAEMPRLMIYELGVHLLDTSRYLFGEASTLYAQTRKISPHIAGEDLATLMLQMDGLTGVIDMSWASIPTWNYDQLASWAEARIEGEKGTLYLRRDGVLRVITDAGEEQHAFPADSELQGYQAAQQHFIDCLRYGAEPETSGAETLKTMELVFGAYDSAAHNRLYQVGADTDRLD